MYAQVPGRASAGGRRMGPRRLPAPPGPDQWAPEPAAPWAGRQPRRRAAASPATAAPSSQAVAGNGTAEASERLLAAPTP